MRPWYLGNTSVRSPLRLRGGLIALSESKLQGNLRGQKQDAAFRTLLGQAGIVELGIDRTNSVGRKWRAALSHLGFLYPAIPRKVKTTQAEIGALDSITENGWRLIRAETVPAMQECFLRALAAYFIPSPLEPKYSFQPFSPLRHILSVMLELERQSGSSRLEFLEMAVIVQLSTSEEAPANIVGRILELRRRREESLSKRRFDSAEYAAAAEKHKYVPSTFTDYADLNFRYLKVTGLVQSKGRGIALVPEKRMLCERLAADHAVPGTDAEYFTNLCRGASLPTDNQDEAVIVLQDLLRQLRSRGIAFPVEQYSQATIADITVLRHKVEELLFERNEEEFAERQASQWEEIAAYMDLLADKTLRKKSLSNGEEISIPRAEAPAYFEWVLWRAFLAINSLANRPYEARRFKIDQDFLPISTAPGNGPDIVLEFEDFVLAVEVTLTENSRQEAAEGETVRRHVADLLVQHREGAGRSVYGMFLANRIDSNTAETFRRGSWHDVNDNELRLDIVPLTLKQFNKFFVALFQHNAVDVQHVRILLDICSRIREEHRAPAWKIAIEAAVSSQITFLQTQPL